MKKRVIIIAIIISLFCNILLIPINTIAKESDYDTSYIGTEIEQYVKENNTYDAAVAVSVINADEVLYEGNFGYADKKRNIPTDENTVYEWGSLSKVLTWISVMQLMEQGKINLQEDIKTYLPDNYLKKVKYDKPITMVDLMNHTGGWQDSITNVYTDDKDDILPLEEYVSKYEPIQLYEPGTTVAYSNWGTTLAGYIVERVSGEDYCDYVTKHILLPLEMNHTSIFPLHGDNNLVKTGLEKIIGYTTDGKEISGRYYAPDYPAAGAAGTMKDVQLLVKALLSENECPLFEKVETLKTMLETTYYFAGTKTPENAHGLWYDFYLTPSLGHYGNTPRFSVHMSIAPTKQLGMIIMTNQAQEMILNHGLGEIVFSENRGEEKHSFKQLTFKRYYTGARTIERGYCRFYHYFQIYQVKQTGDNTIIISSPFMKIPCTRIGENEYCASDGFVKGFHFYIEDNNGIVQKIATSTFDIIPYSSGKVIWETISFILMGMAIVTAFVLGLLCIRKLCNNKKKSNCLPLFMNVFSIFVLVSIIMEAGKLISTAASTKDIIPYVMFYNAYLVTVIGYLVYFIKSKQKDAIRILTLGTSIIIFTFILYWQMSIL